VITASVADNRELGHLVIEVTPPGGTQVDITVLRGIPTQIGSVSIRDPFGDDQFSFTLPSVTIYDRPGNGDLFWLRPFSRVEVFWRLSESVIGTDLENILKSWKWCGYIASWDQNQTEETSQTSVECIGALQILNNIIAIPFIATSPYPVEDVIRRLIKRANDTKLGIQPLTVVHHPSDYAKAKDSDAANIMSVANLVNDQHWSGVATRSVGSLTTKVGDFIKSTLLPMLFTPGGRPYTLMNNNWEPVLKVRADLSADNALHIDLATPGVTFSFSRDFSNAPNSLYTSGKDIDGTNYSSLGNNTPANYKLTKGAGGVLANRLSFNNAAPFAALPSVLNANTMLNEQSITISDGMSLTDAIEVTRKKLLQTADPGYTGTLTISSDPETPAGETFPRYCIKPGMSIEVSGINNSTVLMHISSVEIDFSTGQAQLTVDSKSRDQDTLEEMRARTRDPLDTIRSVNVSRAQYNFQNDILLPWDGSNSGVIPYNTGGKGSTIFKESDDNSVGFPWESVTAKYPPKNYESSYMRVGKTDFVDVKKCYASAMVLLASYADIRMLQMAAYDEDGNVLPVEFHVSFYQNPNADYRSFPQVFQDSFKDDDKSFLKSPYRQRTSQTHTAASYRVYGFRDWSEVKAGSKDQQRFCYFIVDDNAPDIPPDTKVYLQNIESTINSTANNTTKAVATVIGEPLGFTGSGDTDGEKMASRKVKLDIDKTFNMSNKKLVWIVSPNATNVATKKNLALGNTASIACVSATYFPDTKVYKRYTQTQGWGVGTPYPLYELAWCDRYPDGSYIDSTVGGSLNTQYLRSKDASAFINGWGTYYNPAGYWPATQVTGQTPVTGMLQDESVWSVDLTKSQFVRWNTRNPSSYVPAATDYPGQVRVIVFCEWAPGAGDQYRGDVYFLGRMLRKPQGT
jgi:hypothetical protein